MVMLNTSTSAPSFETNITVWACIVNIGVINKQSVPCLVPFFYKNFNIGQSKPDLIINDDKGKEKIVIELKATSSKLSEKEVVQLKKYLQTLGLKKGILINFPQVSKEGREEVEFEVVGI